MVMQEPEPTPQVADIQTTFLFQALAEASLQDLQLSSVLALMGQVTLWLFPKAFSEKEKENKQKDYSTSTEQHWARLTPRKF